MTDKNNLEPLANMLARTQRGIESTLKELKINPKEYADASIAFNYEMSTIVVFTIAEQVLRVARHDDGYQDLAKLFYGQLKGKLREINEGFSGEYKSAACRLEDYLIGPNSLISKEFKTRGITI